MDRAGMQEALQVAALTVANIGYRVSLIISRITDKISDS